MIHWANLLGRQFYGTMGQAFLPVSSVMNTLNPLSLLSKQVGGLSPGCPKSSCPIFSALLSFQ